MDERDPPLGKFDAYIILQRRTYHFRVTSPIWTLCQFRAQLILHLLYINHYPVKTYALTPMSAERGGLLSYSIP